MLTRMTEWYDVKEEKQKFGIKIKHNGKWIHAGDDDGLFIFDDESECYKKRKELAKIRVPI